MEFQFIKNALTNPINSRGIHQKRSRVIPLWRKRIPVSKKDSALIYLSGPKKRLDFKLELLLENVPVPGSAWPSRALPSGEGLEGMPGVGCLLVDACGGAQDLRYQVLTGTTIPLHTHLCAIILVGVPLDYYWFDIYACILDHISNSQNADRFWHRQSPHLPPPPIPCCPLSHISLLTSPNICPWIPLW